MKIGIFVSVTSFWGDGIASRICSCITIFKTCNSTAFFDTKPQNLLCTVQGRKLWLKHCFEDDVMIAMVDAMVLTWYFCLFFGKHQNDLTFSATFNFSSELGAGNYSDSNSPWGNFIRIWWHLMTSEIHIWYITQKMI